MGLQNIGQNVCFFNSVIQTLYSIDIFRQFMRSQNTSDQIVLTIKRLFQLIESPIETYQVIKSIELPHYNHSLRQQFDAQECFVHIICI